MVDKKKDSVAHTCIIIRNPELLEYVIINQPRLLTIVNRNNQTPLQYVEERLQYFRNDQKERESRRSEQQYFSGQRNGDEEIDNLKKCQSVLETCTKAIQRLHTNGPVVE